jgi:molybdopterin-guanine dinucleotide biosynthesis protein A
MPLHSEEVLTTKDNLIRSLSRVTSFFLPNDNPRVGEGGFDQLVTQLHQHIRPITPVCDRYVQYLLAGATHRSFTNTGEGYNLEGPKFPHSTP